MDSSGIPQTRSDEQPRPTICLNMIVRDEAHCITELMDGVAASIDYWVIVDTGSNDGTQELIRQWMAERAIPGELHERPWIDFGHNRTEALALAQGFCDYIWVMDADDCVEGSIPFNRLQADVYTMRLNDGTLYWRRQLFRSGLPWRYVGAVHETADCAVPFSEERLDGPYTIQSRRLGARNNDPNKYLRDAEILLAEHERDPSNPRTLFYLAQSYAWAGEHEQALRWFTRRSEHSGWDEEDHIALMRLAEAMNESGRPWPDVQDAYLRAWNQRPCRAEPLHALAYFHRQQGNYPLAHLFARQAARTPFPDGESLFVQADVYAWRARDEQAVCASWIGQLDEALAIWDDLLTRRDLPDDDRRRITANRDAVAQQCGYRPPSDVINVDQPLQAALVRRLQRRIQAQGELRLPAVPALLETYGQLCLRTFEPLGAHFDVEQRAQLQQVLAEQLAEAYAASARSEIVIRYAKAVGLTVEYQVAAEWTSLGQSYDRWVSSREPPYFGSTADARVWALAAEHAEPALAPVLDVGAGTGRNSLALARRGHPVDAIEMSAQFAAVLRAEAAGQSLGVRVFEQDLFSPQSELRRDYRFMILSEVVSDFRSTAQLRRMFELAAHSLAVGGQLVFNVFLPHVGYVPDAAARELGQQVYTALFTYPEVAAAASGLPLTLVADESVCAYEHRHLPDEAWPPTNWYVDWVNGLDLFDVPRGQSPIAMRWLVYRRTG